MKKINLSSTDQISNSQLSKIMKEVAIDAKKREIQTSNEMLNTIKNDIKIANARFIKK